MIALRRFSLGAVIVLLAACTPSHNIKPLPNFVSVALEPGDRVVVTTVEGMTVEFVVTEVRGDIIVGGDEEYSLERITSLRKYSWGRPESPCGGDKPLGCSLPFLVSLTSESHSHYQKEFYDACAQHDYCYRHGVASYGLDRKTCDDEFLLDMHNLCPPAAEGTLERIAELMGDSVASRPVCLNVADDYYAAVRRYGEDKFQMASSTYCEYNGPTEKLLKGARGSAGNSDPADTNPE